MSFGRAPLETFGIGFHLTTFLGYILYQTFHTERINLLIDDFSKSIHVTLSPSQVQNTEKKPVLGNITFLIGFMIDQ